MFGSIRAHNWVSSPDYVDAPYQPSAQASRSSVQRAIGSLPHSFRRADSGRVLTTADLAWRGWLRGRSRSAGLTADSVAAAAQAFARVGGTGRKAGGLRADATSYYAYDLVDRSGPVVERLVQPASLLAAIPVRNVALSKIAYELRFMDRSASVESRPSGKTTLPLATVSTDSSLRPMYVFHTGYSDNDWRQRQVAANLDFDELAQKAAACDEALDAFLSRTWLISGAPGLDSYHLGNLPGVRRVTSANTYGTTAYDTCIVELVGYLQSFAEVYKGTTRPGVMRCLISRRILHSLSRVSNFAAGGNGLQAMAKIVEEIQSNGFQVTIVDDLNNFGGTNVDGMILMHDYTHGLHHALSMRPAPADTYQVGPVQVTEHATITGGLVCEDRESCMIVNIPITPAPGT